VEVDAQQDAFALHVDVVEGAELFWHLATRGGARASSFETPRSRSAPQDEEKRGNLVPHPEEPGIARSAAPGVSKDEAEAQASNGDLRAACPSRRRCRPCDWRSPTRCRTTTARAPGCRPAPWSGPARRSRSDRRD